MIKRGVWLVVLLLSMSVVLADTAGTTGSYFGYSSVGSGTISSGSSFSTAYPLPDLVVSQIIIPDSLQKYSSLETLAVEIKNIGSSRASGYIYVDIEISGGGISSCKVRSIAGGSNGGAGATNSPYSLRYISLLPGKTIVVPLSTPAIGGNLPGSCQQPISDDITVKAEVNPIGGSTGISRSPRGRILESDMSNNIRQKTVKAVTIPTKENGHDNVVLSQSMKFVPGMNAFSMPLVTEFTVHTFKESTGCELFEYIKPVTSQTSGNRVVDLSDLTLAKLDEKMVPGIPYFARCTYSSTITINGYDPGPFNTKMVYNGLNLLTTRAAMRGLRLSEVANGCGQIAFYAYVGGTRNILSKLLVETALPENPIVPGQVYIATCRNSAGGMWDPSSGSVSYAVIRPAGADPLPYSSRSSGSSIYRPSRIGGRTGYQNYNYNYGSYY